jgi:hypothetical protein
VQYFTHLDPSGRRKKRKEKKERRAQKRQNEQTTDKRETDNKTQTETSTEENRKGSVARERRTKTGHEEEVGKSQEIFGGMTGM